ncbi:MAG: hypothetical protein GX607_20835 [Myxococcales bacterium]|nr:hypothetical protein [Myxococcales bacterium]
MSVPRSLLGRLVAALVLLSPTVHADPPAMREDAAEPTIEMASEDRDYTLALGGFFQARAHGFALREPDDVPNFGLPRTRLYLFGRAAPDLRYRLMVGTLPYQERARIFDAYAEWALHEALRLRIGRFKIPALRGWIESGRELATLERAPAVLHTLPGRAVGALASVDASEHLELSFGGFERRGDPALKDGVGSRAVALRALWNLQGRRIEGELDLEESPWTVALGTSSVWSFAGREQRQERLAAVDVALRGRGLDAVVEGGVHERDRGSTERAWFVYARAHHYVAPLRSAVGVRASHLVALDAVSASALGSALGSAFGSAENHHELELDVSWLPRGHDAKVTSAVLARKRGPRPWGPGGALQVQVAF